ncbi:MAG: hypothetical protein Q4E03_05650 [Trueperella sp.]|nr:hypothetical protein [Trueperella sp.]
MRNRKFKNWDWTGDFRQSRLAEPGDVPGWVMITLMTAALVVMLWAIAGPALTDLFNNAIDRILNI